MLPCQVYDGAVGAISVSAVCGFHELVKGSARIDVIMVRSDKGEEEATCPSDRTFDLRIFCVDTVHSTYLIDGQFSQHLISTLNHCGSEHGRLTWHPIIHPRNQMIFQAIRTLNLFLRLGQPVTHTEN